MAPPPKIAPWYENARDSKICLRRAKDLLAVAVYDGCPANEILSEITNLLDKLTIIILFKGKVK